MKIRQGFVSNSSSTSFCIYGICIDRDEMITISDGCFSAETIIDQIENELGLESYYGDSYIYLGQSWSDIEDDQTGREFRDEIEQKITSKIPNIDKASFGTYEESWYDG